MGDAPTIGNPLHADQDPDPVLWEQLQSVDHTRVTDPQILAMHVEILTARVDELYEFLRCGMDREMIAAHLPINALHSKGVAK